MKAAPASRADMATGATVVAIAIRVHAGPAATACATLADSAAGGTVVGVRVRIYAGPVAIRGPS